jgi:hypothetical protein
MSETGYPASLRKGIPVLLRVKKEFTFHTKQPTLAAKGVHFPVIADSIFFVLDKCMS